MQVIKNVIILSFAILVVGCKTNSESKVIEEKKARSVALIKVQDATFDASQKDAMLAPYVLKSEVTIPSDLPGQNKWFMFEGPVLENDKVAYRFYGDARHRSDIYGKKVSDLVMDTVSWNYHDIMDWGSDILKVGNSLGIGSPGILYQDSVYSLSDWSRKTIKTSGEGEIIFLFEQVKVGDYKFDIEQKWLLAAGTFWSDITVKVIGGSLPDDMKWVTGIVKHLDKYSLDYEGGYTYLSTWGNQSYHHQDLGMAVATDLKASYYQDQLSHCLVFDDNKDAIRYAFMANWSEGVEGAKTQESFSSLMKQSKK